MATPDNSQRGPTPTPVASLSTFPNDWRAVSSEGVGRLRVAVPQNTVQQRTNNPSIEIPEYLRIIWRRARRPISYVAVLQTESVSGGAPDLSLDSALTGEKTPSVKVKAVKSRRIWFEIYLCWAKRMVLLSMLAAAAGAVLLGLNAGGVEPFGSKNVVILGAVLLGVGALAGVITELRAHR